MTMAMAPAQPNGSTSTNEQKENGRNATTKSPPIITTSKRQQQPKDNNKSNSIMWALGGLSLCVTILASFYSTGLLLVGSSLTSSDANNSDGALHPSSRHERHTAASKAAKQLKKATRQGGTNTLINERNINRGAEGTVTKDIMRGPALKAYFDEDNDDEEDWDDEDFEDDEERPYEERQLKAKEKQEKEGRGGELPSSSSSSSSKAKGSSVNEEKPEPEPEKWWEEKKKAQPEKKPSEAEKKKKKVGESAAEESKQPTAETKKQPTRTKAKTVPRRWESNAAAVVKIIDADAHPHFKLTPEGKKMEEAEEEEEEDSSDDDEDSSDDDGEDEEEDLTTYVPLPNLATYTPDEAAAALTTGFTSPLQRRLSSMFEKATTHECRAKIAEHAALFVNGFAEETKFPFDDFHFPNTCKAIPRYGDWDHLPEGVKVQDVQHRTYQPPRDSVPEGTYLEDADELVLLYVILTHDAPEATIRLMESVYVEGFTKFAIHVDGKEKSDATYSRLVEYAKEKNHGAVRAGKEEYVRIVPNERRVRVNWGGFSMVDATLKALHTVFGLDHHHHHHHDAEEDPDIDNPRAFTFHKLVHLASTTYPLASNTEIRHTLASYPLDANFLHIILRPNNPTPSVWNYFVECDDALHRIYRMPALNFERGNGVDVYTSSQWFVISREFAWYLANPPEGSFVKYYLQYIEHVVVADEAFFGTVVRNTHFCATLHNDNFLHLQFDRWENEASGARDQRKCVMKNRNHCGRSPTTLTVDYLPVLELSGDLFARKFDDEAEPLIKDYIDRRREKDEERLRREAELTKEMGANNNGTEAKLPLEDWEFQGEGVMMVAKETLTDDVPLCMGLSTDGNKVMLQPCFKDDVPPTLSEGWEEGAVIIEEVDGLNRWDIGPCSSDGELKRKATGELEMIPGEYSDRGPSCGIKLGDGPRQGRCLDVPSEKLGPGGLLHVFPCFTRWHQMFSFGNGTIAPKGSVHASLPAHIARETKKKEGEVHQHLCLGVVGRGDMEESWILYTEEEMEEFDPWELNNATRYPSGRKSLQLWSGEQLMTTPCSNKGAVIEWYYIPFIVEEYEDEEADEHSEGTAEEDDEEL